MVTQRIPTVVLASGADNHLLRYTAAIQQLEAANIGEHALVGGFAVMLRLANAHRVTEDIDTVTWTRDGTSKTPIRILTALGAKPTRNGVDIGDIHIDLIPVSDYDPAQLPSELGAAMFVITHSLALKTATPIKISALNALHKEELTVTVQVASSAALVAMKLGAIPHRRGESLHKRASDTYDAYCLLAEHDRNGGVASSLAAASDALGPWCANQARELFDINADRTKGWLNTGSPAMTQITAGQLRTVGTLFADTIDNFGS